MLIKVHADHSWFILYVIITRVRHYTRDHMTNEYCVYYGRTLLFTWNKVIMADLRSAFLQWHR